MVSEPWSLEDHKAQERVKIFTLPMNFLLKIPIRAFVKTKLKKTVIHINELGDAHWN